jgi:hypothetical protein
MTATASIRVQPGRPVIERASPTDRAFLAMEARRRIPEQFGVVLLLDQDGGLDLAQARQLIAQRVPAVPRLRQRLIRPPFGCGGPIWVDDPHFDIRRHVRAVACRAPGDEPALLQAAQAEIAAPLPRTPPLWSAALITGLADDSVALVLVLHHAHADGVGGLAVLANMIDAPAHPPAGSFPRPAPTVASLARDTFGSRLQSMRHGARSWQLLRASMGASGGLRPPRATPCSLNQPTGARRHLCGLRQAGVDEHEPVRRLERDHTGEAGHHHDPGYDGRGDAHRGAVREQPAHRGLAPPHPLGILGERVHKTPR